VSTEASGTSFKAPVHGIQTTDEGIAGTGEDSLACFIKRLDAATRSIYDRG
jgi:hypothetical protein